MSAFFRLKRTITQKPKKKNTIKSRGKHRRESHTREKPNAHSKRISRCIVIIIINAEHTKVSNNDDRDREIGESLRPGRSEMGFRVLFRERGNR